MMFIHEENLSASKAFWEFVQRDFDERAAALGISKYEHMESFAMPKIDLVAGVDGVLAARLLAEYWDNVFIAFVEADAATQKSTTSL